MEKGAMLVSGSKPLTLVEKLTNALCFIIVVAVFGMVGAEFGKAPSTTYSGSQPNCIVTPAHSNCQK
jgi:hypothetical protein